MAVILMLHREASELESVKSEVFRHWRLHLFSWCRDDTVVSRQTPHMTHMVHGLIPGRVLIPVALPVWHSPTRHGTA